MYLCLGESYEPKKLMSPKRRLKFKQSNKMGAKVICWQKKVGSDQILCKWTWYVLFSSIVIELENLTSRAFQHTALVVAQMAHQHSPKVHVVPKCAWRLPFYSWDPPPIGDDAEQFYGTRYWMVHQVLIACSNCLRDQNCRPLARPGIGESTKSDPSSWLQVQESSDLRRDCRVSLNPPCRSNPRQLVL